jgi:DNA ligase-1
MYNKNGFKSLVDEQTEWKEKMAQFRPMLASNVDMTAVSYPVLCSPKFDGIRCVILDGTALSRKLKPIPNRHVQALLQTCPDNLDGELIIPKKTFNQTQSAIMSEEGTPKFVYHVFDIIDKKAPYQDRMERLQDTELPSFCQKVLPLDIHSEPDLLEYETACLKEGYEGVMIRDPDGPYKYGRSTPKQGYLAKLKRFTDAEATIVGFEELQHNMNEAETDELGFIKRSHKKAGMVPADKLGAFVVESDGKRFKVATGMTDAERSEYWEHKETMLGKLVKYKFQEAGGKDLPRFPVFLGIRHPDDLD